MAAKLPKAAPGDQQQGYNEYRVKLANVGSKNFHVMRFKPPHKCDLEKLVNPTLDRQTVKKEEEAAPEEGEGSEYGWRRREEARRKRRGLASRRADPDDKPWVLREQKRGGKHFIGRKEGTFNTSSSCYVFTVGQDGAFEAYPVQNWYDFVPPVKYNYLNAEEAEERFERRNKTLNLFSIMLSKKLRGVEGEEEEGGGEGAEPSGAGRPGAGGSSKGKGKGKAQDLGLLLTDSEDSDITSEESEGEGHSKPSQNKNPGKALLKRKRRKKSQTKHGDSEAGEDTDEGEWESREVDYMSDSTSGSEHEYQAKQAMKEAPKDDEELERQEEGDIDKGFIESSSSSEDELTEEGKELKALMSKHSGGDGSEPKVEDEEGPDVTERSEAMLVSPAKGEEKTGSRPTTPSKSGKAAKKEEKQKKSSPSKAHKRDRESEQNSSQANDPSTPPSKKHRTESSSTISEEEVQRYLSRKPITSKDLVKKFTGKKTEMDRNKIVEVLGQIIQHMKGVTRQNIKGKLYLSLKSQEQ